MWEIDENPIRAELSPSEQAEHLAKRKTLWEQRFVGGSTCATEKPQHKKKFAADKGDKTGVSKSAVNRARVLARRVGGCWVASCKEAKPIEAVSGPIWFLK